VKLAAADQQTLRDQGGGPFGPPERPMPSYVTLPPTCAEASAKRWVARSIQYVGGLPPKNKAVRGQR
jgi:hypothetical protein